MGYEKMDRRFPCPCGKGTQLAEWEEHDTWVHGNEGAEYTLECPECAARYTYSYGSWVGKEDKQKSDALYADRQSAEAELKQLIVERYEEKYIAHVLSRRNRTQMKLALWGAPTGFLKNAKDNPSFVEGVARESIRTHPYESFRELQVDDPDVSGIVAKIESIKKESSQLRERMKSIPVPDKRSPLPKIPA